MNGLYPPSLDGEVVRSMKTAGFKTLNLSLGSTSSEQLKRFNRSDVRSAFERALQLAEDYELGAVGYVICAAPFQRVEDSLQIFFIWPDEGSGRRVCLLSGTGQQGF